MTYDDKRELLVKRLHDRTIHGQLIWTECIQNDMFQTTFPNATIKIENNSNDEVCISFFNHQATLIESFNENKFSTLHTTFHELYENARRIALNADKVLDEVLASLEAL